MKVLQINSFGNLSTGKIAVDIYKALVENGHEGIIAFARGTIENNIPYIKIGNKCDVALHGLMTRLTDKTGFYSKKATKTLLKNIDDYNPDVIHLHNLHGYYINIKMLFDYIRKAGKPVIWTIHDCWPFTGHCCYFDDAGCQKWSYGCEKCPQKNSYPKSFLDRSKWNYENKQMIFSNIPNMTIVSVSKWLDALVAQSFLGRYTHLTIHNGIDLAKFKPTPSNFREKYDLENKFLIIGVASTWSVRKGFDDFLKLSEQLDDRYRIVLVGLTPSQIKKINPNMIGLTRTATPEELAGLYTTADVFFNASIEESFGLPTIEATACGTPAVVYNATAIPECVRPETGYIVDKHDIGQVITAIKKIQNEHFVVNKSVFEFDKRKLFQKYITLYEKILREH